MLDKKYTERTGKKKKTKGRGKDSYKEMREIDKEINERKDRGKEKEEEIEVERKKSKVSDK